jgi:signal transduction histidine kinase
MRTISLRARLTVLLAVAVLVALGAAAKIVDWRADTEMQQRFDAMLLARAQSLAALTQIESGRIVVDAADAGTTVFPGNANASWYALRCGRTSIARTAEAPPPVAVGDEPVFADAQLRDGRMLRVVALQFKPMLADGHAAPPGAPVCTLRYALARGPLDDLLDTLDFILLGSLLGACLVVMLATPWLVRRGLRPLTVLNDAMAGIGPDTPGGRLPASDTRELAPLVARFNEVLARMDAGLARERHFASGLAHEFRTRLAELRALVDVETRYPGGRDTSSVLRDVGSIGAELEATVTALLQLTRIQSGLERSQPESVPLAPLLKRLCARHLDAAKARGLRLQTEFAGSVDGNFAIEAEPALLEIVLDNLLGNAVAYAPPGGTVAVHAGRTGIEVRNAAPSQQPEDLANFGQRFWRKGSEGTGHAGLGLALASAAARALRMTLSFDLEDHAVRAALRWAATQVSA